MLRAVDWLMEERSEDRAPSKAYMFWRKNRRKLKEQVSEESPQMCYIVKAKGGNGLGGGAQKTSHQGQQSQMLETGKEGKVSGKEKVCRLRTITIIITHAPDSGLCFI